MSSAVILSHQTGNPTQSSIQNLNSRTIRQPQPLFSYPSHVLPPSDSSSAISASSSADPTTTVNHLPSHHHHHLLPQVVNGSPNSLTNRSNLIQTTKTTPSRSSGTHNASGFTVQRELKNGKEREVIVIESDGEDDETKTNGSQTVTIQPPIKRRKIPEGYKPSTLTRTNAIPSTGKENVKVSTSSQLIPTPTSLTKGKRKLEEFAADGGETLQAGTGKVVKTGISTKIPAVPQTEPVDDKEGHFIVRANLELHHRYRIIRLLGQGTFGKVVQCYDNQTGKEVAVKIIRAVQKYREASKVEIKVLKLLKEKDPHNVNKCIHLQEYFDYKNHICIVSELLSSSVFDFLKDNGYHPFPESQIQSFARQLLQSVSFLHDLRLIHTDLKPENILLVSNSVRRFPPTHYQHRPHKVLQSSSIRLIDFGSATFDEEYHASVVSTRHYRAPEIILGMGWTFPCDVWSIGCILIEFFTGEALFQTHENLEHLAMMEVVFGKMPVPYAREAARGKPEWFKGYKLDFPNATTSRQSRKYVKAMRHINEIIPSTNLARTRFKDLLLQLLQWDPAERLTVKEALRHPYFQLKIEDEGTEPYRSLPGI